MLGPVIGKMMADVICAEKPALPIEKLDLERFERNELIVEPACVRGGERRVPWKRSCSYPGVRCSRQ
ncbi:MAG: hypothetical protein ACOZCF_13315 [Bacillota bacterium]